MRPDAPESGDDATSLSATHYNGLLSGTKVKRRPSPSHSGGAFALTDDAVGLAASETYDGRLIAPYSRGHPAVCRCCNFGPKHRALRERLVGRSKLASRSPFVFGAVIA